MATSRPGGAPLRLTVVISVDSDELVASKSAGAELEGAVAGLLEAYPGAQVTVDHVLNAAREFTIQE